MIRLVKNILCFLTLQNYLWLLFLAAEEHEAESSSVHVSAVDLTVGGGDGGVKKEK